MKVRHKHHGRVWEVIDEGKTFYTVCEPRYNPQIENCGSPFAASKAEYELVPEPDHWQDVTDRCAVHADSMVCDDALSNPDAGDHVIADIIGGYRLRKVQLWEIPNELVKTVVVKWNGVKRNAFIVERKVSE